MSDIKVVNIGNIIGNTFPSNDGRVYLYKRDNGHLYTYINGVEKHICCDDGLITTIPVFTAHVNVVAPTHRPDAGHVMLYMYGGKVYAYDHNLVITSTEPLDTIPTLTVFPSVENPPLDIPAIGEYVLFIFEGLLYSYGHDLVPILIGGTTPEGAVVIEGVAQW